MSVKEFFAFSVIKQKVMDFLKVKGDFEALHSKHKRPFRAHIIKQDGDFYVSDDFHQIKCSFSDQCRESFERRYPESTKLFNIVDMLICIQEYRLLLKTQDGSSSTQGSEKPREGPVEKWRVEVGIVIDEVHVISFDRFTLKLCPSVEYDDGARLHLNFVQHHLLKKCLMEEKKYENMPPITKYLQTSSVFQNAQVNRHSSDQKRRLQHQDLDDFDYVPGRSGNYSDDESQEMENILELKATKQTSEQIANSKRKQKLRKLKTDVMLDGFMSCSSQQELELIDTLQEEIALVLVNAHQGQQPTQTMGMTQKIREEELNNIDDIMEDLIDDEDAGSEAPASPSMKSSLSEHSFVNVERKSHQLTSEQIQAIKLQEKAKEAECNLIAPSLEEILGCENLQLSQGQQVSLFKQVVERRSEGSACTDNISNSSSVIKNEALRRKAEEEHNRNKIELEIEMTEEQMKQEQQLMFGSLPPGDIIGFGINASQNQRDFRESITRQGQGGQLSSEKLGKFNTIDMSQDDLLDILEGQKTQKVKASTNISQPKSPAKEGKGKQTTLPYLIERKERKIAVKQQEKEEKSNQKVSNLAQLCNMYQESSKVHEVVVPQKPKQPSESKPDTTSNVPLVPAKRRGRPPKNK